MSNLNFAEIQGAQNLLGTTAVSCEQPVIEGTVFTGVNFMCVNTDKLTNLTRHSGADIWCVTADAVITGNDLFGTYKTMMPGDVIAAIDTAHWTTVFGQIAYKQTSVKHPKYFNQLQIGNMPPADVAKALKAKWPNLKMLIVDNVLDYLPSWTRLGKKADHAEVDLAPLHRELVANDIALLAILDKSNADHAKLKKQIGTNASGYNLISIKDTGRGTLAFRVKGPLSKQTVSLELDSGKWIVKPTSQTLQTAPADNAAVAATPTAQVPGAAKGASGVTEATQAEAKAEAAA